MEGTGYEVGRRNTRLGAGFAGAPVLLALAFLVVTSLDLSGPGFTSFGRDAGHTRAVARPLTEALARAVRGMVGVQTQRPVARDQAREGSRADWRGVADAGARELAGAPGHHVRVGLLNLPPPGLRA